MNKTTKWYAGPLYVIIAVALVMGLTLVPGMVPTLAPVAGPIVEASSVSGITVNVSNTTPGINATYIINFTTNVALLPTAADTITIEFPRGTTSGTNISGFSASSAHVGNATTNATQVTSVNIGGRRLSLTVAAVVYAGHVTVILNNTLIQNPRPEANYTLKVYTTQEPTAVTSSYYIIDTKIVMCRSANNTVRAVNKSALWSFNFSAATALVANSDTVTIIFPPTTTLPASITAVSNVTFNGTALDYVTDYSVSGQNMTLTVPTSVAEGHKMYINVTLLSGLRNPTDIRDNWTVQMFTSKDRGINTSGTWCTSAGNMSAISYLAWDGWDEYIHNNTNSSSTFKIIAKDVFGNNATVNKTTTLALGGAGGTFYLADGGAAIGTIDIEYADGASCATAVFYYKSKVPGTKTLTASEVVTYGWTAASKTVTISPNIQLWGGGSIIGNYTTITLAEAAAVPYDTIKVLPGTYDERVVINVDYLTLESTGGAAVTTIDGTSLSGGNPVMQVVYGTDNVTIEGFNVTAARLDGIWIMYGTKGTVFKNNIVHNATHGVALVYDASSYPTYVAANVTVSGNVMKNCTGDGVSMSGCNKNCTISNNTIKSCAGRGIGFTAGTTADRTQDNNITGNTITNCGWRGIFVKEGRDSSNAYGGTTVYFDNNAIVGNTISGGDAYGIQIAADDAHPRSLRITNLIITGNTITSYPRCGIKIECWGSGYGSIKNNNIYGNTRFAINSTNATAADCTLNYWGNASGPSGNGTGTGDRISASVTYSPWLNAAYPGGSSTTGVNINLTADWNFISVPKKLENATFGWLLSGQDISQSYGYDPGTGWTLLTGSSPVEVLAGYWVSANAAGRLNLTFVSTGQGVPASKDLTGNKWNAIGFSNTTATTAMQTLQSVNSTWSNALGWNATNQIYDAAIIWPGSGTNMNPGGGYWLWMTANDTLAALSA